MKAELLDLFLNGSLVRDALWQSTLWLLVGLLASSRLAKRPARAHAILLIASLGALLTPIASALIRFLDLGLLQPSAAARSAATPLSNVLLGPSAAQAGLQWESSLLILWLLLAAFVCIRNLRAIAASRHLVHSAESITSGNLTHRAALLAQRMGIANTPELFSSRSIQGPLIWCWSRRPKIYLPAPTPNLETMDGILIHELAHYKRRDHWSSQISIWITGFLAWNPLMHLVHKRMDEACEQACDRWALDRGARATEYAEALLGLAPQMGSGLVLGAKSSRASMARRLTAILNAQPSPPTSGRAFSFASAGLAAVMLSALALGESKPPAQAEPSGQTNQADQALAALAPAKGLQVFPAELDFGSVPAGSSGHASLWIVNTDSVVHELEAVKPSCGCVSLKDFSGTQVLPGTAIEVPLAMEASTEAGARKTKTVLVAVRGQAPLKVPIHIHSLDSDAGEPSN